MDKEDRVKARAEKRSLKLEPKGAYLQLEGVEEAPQSNGAAGCTGSRGVEHWDAQAGDDQHSAMQEGWRQMDVGYYGERDLGLCSELRNSPRPAPIRAPPGSMDWSM